VNSSRGKLLASLLASIALVAFSLAAAPAQAVRVNGQILAYQQGFVFFTTGDGFRVSPSVVFEDAKTGGPTALRPAPQMWARATFDASGTVTELDLSKAPLSPAGDFSLVQRFAVAISSPVPNPDLGQPAVPSGGIPRTFSSGRMVIVVFKVQVPPATPFNAQVYMATDTSGWNPQAIPMQRTDALHFEVVERLASGTIFHFLYTRGSFASEERTEGGLEVKPHEALVSNVDGQVYNTIVYQWADQTTSGQVLQQPNVFPTPYNPAPFPNLPPGIHTPAPSAR
jgi:hypothetical protein